MDLFCFVSKCVVIMHGRCNYIFYGFRFCDRDVS